MSAGASLGTRYDVKFDATNPYGATTLGISTLGAANVYALVEYRPWKRLRLQYTHDNSDLRPLDQILFQYTVTYGPHPAHRY